MGHDPGVAFPMTWRVTLVVLLQFVLPAVVSVRRELSRTVPRSNGRRLWLAFSAVTLGVVPLAVLLLILGRSMHMDPVDWYLAFCLFSGGAIPIVVGKIVVLIVSAFLEPTIRLLRLHYATESYDERFEVPTAGEDTHPPPHWRTPHGRPTPAA